ncbi:synaptotagmin-like protein 5 isoform X3 [Watersipora subatra]|uniref:synaptotagmin-like protein 5 isoform X3 n=1 Tax=Watersipora subatra TaxID=2589382 RepID=UPI00355B1CE0
MSGVHLDFELDLDFLSVEERDIILAVLKRDEALRKAEQERKSDLKNEISQLRQQSALRVGSQQKNRQCIRCQQEFGILFKKGEVCVKCKHRICMNCRVNIGNSSTFAWLCSLCYKQRLLPAVAGDWFYSKVEERHKYDINALHGSDVVRSSIRRSRHLTEEDQDRLKNLTGRSNPFDEDASPPGANNKSKPRSGNESPTYVHAADSRVVRRVRSKGLRNSSSSSGGSSSEEESEEVKSRQKQLLRKLSNTSSEEGEPEQSDTSHANSRTGSSKDDLDGTKRPGTNTEQREFAAIQQAQAELRGASSISDGSDSLDSDDMTTDSGLDECARRKIPLTPDLEIVSPMIGRRELDISAKFLKDFSDSSSDEDDEVIDVFAEGDLEKYTLEMPRVERTQVQPTLSVIREEDSPTNTLQKSESTERKKLKLIINPEDFDSPVESNERDEGLEETPVTPGKYSSNWDDLSTTPREAHLSKTSSWCSDPNSTDTALPGESESTIIDDGSLLVDDGSLPVDAGHLQVEDNDDSESTPVSSGFDVFGLPGSGPLDHLRCTLCAEHFGGKPPHQNAAVTEELKKKLADRQLRYSPVDNTSMGNQPESETSSMGRKGSLAPEIVVSVAQSEAAVDSDDPMCHSMDDIDDFDIESPAFKARKTGRKSSQLSNTLTVSTESITSALSEAGADYSKHDITGDLKLSVAFDKPTGLLTLTIHECRDLVAVNKKKNISDPYVKAYLVSGSQKFNKRKTRIVKGTVNPVFEETFTYTLSHSDMYTKTLQISVWNNHRLGHKDFLGEVNIVFNAAFEGTAGQARWLNLGKKVENNADILPPSAPDLGIALKYVPTRVIPKKDAKDKVAKAELHVKLLCARNLPTKKHGMYDPYAKCVMLPEKAKQKTATVKNDLNPVWDETFTFPKKTTSELRESSLEISVIDYDRFSANDLIGTVKLNLGKGKAGGKEVDWMSASEPAKELWDNMIRTPGEWQEGWLPIDLVVKPE